MPLSPGGVPRRCLFRRRARLALAACTPAPDRPRHPPPRLAGRPAQHPRPRAERHPDTSQVLLATHDGLFDVTNSPPKIGGPTI